MSEHRSRPRPKSTAPKAAAATALRREAPSITPESYRREAMFPRIEKAVLSILTSSKVVAPVDAGPLGFSEVSPREMRLDASRPPTKVPASRNRTTVIEVES